MSACSFLIRVSKHLCVACGTPAELYCSRCEHTPYCGQRCQRSDWVARHSSVCHNLMRSPKPHNISEDAVSVENNIQPAMPLRKPRSPVVQGGVRRDQGISGNQKFTPSNHGGEQKTTQYNSRGPRNNNNGYTNNNGYNRQDKKPVNNYRRNDGYNNTDTQSNQPQPSASRQSKDFEYSKPVSYQPQPPVNKEPAVEQNDTAAKVKPGPALAELTSAKQPEAVTSSNLERTLVPKDWLVGTMSVGDTAMLSLDARAEDCATTQPGFVCLSISEGSEERFQGLCGPFGVLCAAGERVVSVTPGESFAYYDSTDEAWYRARCLSPASAALVDGCKLVKLESDDKYTALPAEYADVAEFCCVLQASGAALGNSLKATVVSKTASGCKVSLVSAETGASVGEGEVSRWLPDVEYPKPTPAAPAIPEVPRPDVTHESRVVVVEASAGDRVLVRPADREAMRRFDSLLEDVIVVGVNAQPLTEPPVKGQTVIALYTDEVFYRALCRRTSVKQNKYLLEYIEYGNTEVTQLEKLYPCPPELCLTSRPTQVSAVRLSGAVTSLSPPAARYLEKIRDDVEELVLTIPGGASSASTGAEVCLTVAKNKESVNSRVTEMCKPEWKKLEERGGDVLESEVIMNDLIEYLELPAGGCSLDVLDVSALACGTVSACEQGGEHARHVLGPLTDRMADYCNSILGREPYLPSLMEVCIAKCPPYPQWFRAVLVEHRPGEPEARVCYIDYGNIESVPVTELRKMLPEFVRGVPALALYVEINDFPKDPTPLQLGRAVAHLQLTDEGRGILRAERCERRMHGVYAIDAPALLEAMRA